MLCLTGRCPAINRSPRSKYFPAVAAHSWCSAGEPSGGQPAAQPGAGDGGPSTILTSVPLLPAAKCILKWAVQRDNCWCPQCKAPFQYLFTYRNLDGTLNDFPQEESVVLLKRAEWFVATLKVSRGAISTEPCSCPSGCRKHAEAG